MRRISSRLSIIMGLGLLFNTPAMGDAFDAVQFHEIFRSSVAKELRNDAKFSRLHMVPDAAIQSATEAESLEEAINRVSRSALTALVSGTEKIRAQSFAGAADSILQKTPVTMVIVPGIFGELIKVRGFEDVLEKPSRERDEFKTLVAAARKAGDPNGEDLTLNNETMKEEAKSLDKLIHVGSITDASGRTVVRVVLLYTPFLSRESMGSLGGPLDEPGPRNHAGLFNRRLSKYLALTGEQNLVLVGYSRGTDLALEMASQAKERSLPLLKSIKGIVALGGVTWGSSLADDTKDPNSPMHLILTQLKELRDRLDRNTNLFTATWEWTKFLVSLTPVATDSISKALHQLPSVRLEDLTAPQDASSYSLDLVSLLTLTKLMATEFGLHAPAQDFAINVDRFQNFVDAVLDGVDQLTTQARVEWFRTHTLPKEITYYAISAAMPNPSIRDDGGLNAQIFSAGLGYSKPNSFDDSLLLQDRSDYEKVTHLFVDGKAVATPPIVLNDSQVSIGQVMFLPNYIEKLNPANAGLKTKFLGTVGTHHWGLALRVVNAMRDGRVNPFPREALLKALAAKVAADMQN